MKTLILGGSGQLGRALQTLVPRGTLPEAPPRSALDIADPGAARAWIRFRRPDLILNVAAHTKVDQAESEPEASHTVNTLAPGWLAEGAREVGARFVHVSTDFVFDGASKSPYAPDAATNPLNVYGRTKRDGELAVLAAHPEALIVRTSWLYAREGHNFMRTMLARMIRREPLKVVNDQIGTPTLSSSAAAALWSLGQMQVSGVLHYSDSGRASWYDFAVAIQKEALASGLLTHAVPIVPIASADYEARARRPHFSVLDCRRAWDLIGATPRDWRSNLSATIRALAAEAP